MELRTTREMRRNAQLDKIMGRKSETPDTPAKAQSPRRQEPADKLTLSQQALAWADEQNQKMWDAAREQEPKQHDWLSGMLDSLETQKKELDFLDKEMDIMRKCQKIAASIMKGDNVPPEDLIYLMEHDKEGYKMALALRKPKEDPEDCESVLDDEDKKVGSSERTSGGGETPSVESSSPSAGGGDASCPAG